MIRKGEINPFELRKMASATATDYAASVITLLGQMMKDDPTRRDGLNRTKAWIERELRGENVAPMEPAVEIAPTEPTADIAASGE